MIKRAKDFAENAHKGQLRKYTREPYIEHPIAVARLVATVTSDTEIIAAALLHDVVEDTDYTVDDISKNFGAWVAALVSDLTDVSVASDGNRATRKEIDRLHTAQAHNDAKTIKLADLIDNTISIITHDPKFAKVYMAEKKALLGVLVGGSEKLYLGASAIVEKYYEDSK